MVKKSKLKSKRTSKPKKSHKGLIAGLSIGGVVALIAGALVVMYFLGVFKKKSKPRQSSGKPKQDKPKQDKSRQDINHCLNNYEYINSQQFYRYIDSAPNIAENILKSNDESWDNFNTCQSRINYIDEEMADCINNDSHARSDMILSYYNAPNESGRKLADDLLKSNDKSWDDFNECINSIM